MNKKIWGIICFVSALFITALINVKAETKMFEDNNLNKKVSEKLNKTDFSEDDLYNIYDLNLSNIGNININGIEKIDTLKTLYLDNDVVTNFNQLSKLDGLNQLSLNGVKNIDFNTLANIRFLKYLSLNNCGLTKVDDLTKLTRVRNLWIKGNSITDLSLLNGKFNNINAANQVVNFDGYEFKDNKLIIKNPLKDVNGNTINKLSFYGPIKAHVENDNIVVEKLSLTPDKGTFEIQWDELGFSGKIIVNYSTFTQPVVEKEEIQPKPIEKEIVKPEVRKVEKEATNTAVITDKDKEVVKPNVEKVELVNKNSKPSVNATLSKSTNKESKANVSTTSKPKAEVIPTSDTNSFTTLTLMFIISGLYLIKKIKLA